MVDQFHTQFHNFRSKMHCEHFKPHDSLERALDCRPSELSSDDKWIDLCGTFVDAKYKVILNFMQFFFHEIYFNFLLKINALCYFQKRSEINSINRSKQQILHCSGTKGFRQVEYEMVTYIS